MAVIRVTSEVTSGVPRSDLGYINTDTSLTEHCTTTNGPGRLVGISSSFHAHGKEGQITVSNESDVLKFASLTTVAGYHTILF